MKQNATEFAEKKLRAKTLSVGRMAIGTGSIKADYSIGPKTTPPKRKDSAKKSFLVTVTDAQGSSEYSLNANDVQLISDALQIINPDRRTKTKRARQLESIFDNFKTVRVARSEKSCPVFIEVSGGVVSSVKNCRQSYALIDWDNLLGDAADTREEWKQLSKTAQRFIESEYPEDFDKIQDRIAGLQGD